MPGIDKPSITIVKKVGCGSREGILGSVNCIFVEHHNGNFDYLLIRGSMTRRVNCADSWFGGVAKLLTYALRRAFKEDSDSMQNGIVRQLLYHQCGVCGIGTETSCISAIGRALETYLKRKGK